MWSFLFRSRRHKPRRRPLARPQDPYWQRNARLRYVRLVHMAARADRLAGKGGVFVIWTQGVQRGTWVYCGHSPDLAEAVRQVIDAPAIVEWENRARLAFTWAPIRADRRDGVVAYLRGLLAFAVDDAALDEALGLSRARLRDADPVPVLPPG